MCKKQYWQGDKQEKAARGFGKHSPRARTDTTSRAAARGHESPRPALEVAAGAGTPFHFSIMSPLQRAQRGRRGGLHLLQR